MNKWGIELNGTDRDKKLWRASLKSPFDPYVEEVMDERGDYLTLRSSMFDQIDNAEAVHKCAKELFRTLNVVMSMTGDSDTVKSGAVIEYVPNSRPLKHHRPEIKSARVVLQGGVCNIPIIDAQGNVIETPPFKSRAQDWMYAIAENKRETKTEYVTIGRALSYLEGKPDWINLYNAYEALKRITTKHSISNNEIDRFARTANMIGIRHGKLVGEPPQKSMELWEARVLINTWVAAAIEDILDKSRNDNG